MNIRFGHSGPNGAIPLRAGVLPVIASFLFLTGAAFVVLGVVSVVQFAGRIVRGLLGAAPGRHEESTDTQDTSSRKTGGSPGMDVIDTTCEVISTRLLDKDDERP